MRKKTLLLVLVAVAVFALPATAPADELVDGEGTALEVGAEVTATSTNTQLFFNGFSIVCKLVTLHGELAANGPEHVTIEKINVTTKECTRLGEGSKVAFITAPTLTKLTLFQGEGVTIATYKFDVPSLALFECHQEGGISIAYAKGSSEFAFALSKLTGGGPGNCQKESQISGDFSLENKAGVPVVIQ